MRNLTDIYVRLSDEDRDKRCKADDGQANYNVLYSSLYFFCNFHLKVFVVIFLPSRQKGTNACGLPVPMIHQLNLSFPGMSRKAMKYRT